VVRAFPLIDLRQFGRKIVFGNNPLAGNRNNLGVPFSALAAVDNIILNIIP
jgi:hypothetical protein